MRAGSVDTSSRHVWLCVRVRARCACVCVVCAAIMVASGMLGVANGLLSGINTLTSQDFAPSGARDAAHVPNFFA
eukprot:COSAG05_NODE_20559_length_278_cov_0.865922_1_plen_74_part_01